MTILRSGSNRKYAENWEAAFGKPPAEPKTAKAKPPAKTKPPAKAKKRTVPKKSK